MAMNYSYLLADSIFVSEIRLVPHQYFMYTLYTSFQIVSLHQDYSYVIKYLL